MYSIAYLRCDAAEVDTGNIRILLIVINYNVAS